MNRPFTHSCFDSKIMFLNILIRVISLMTGKMVPGITRALQRITNLSIILS